MIVRWVGASLLRRFRQLALIVLAVAVAAATVAALGGFVSRAHGAMTADLAAFGPNLVVRPQIGAAGRLEAGAVARIRRLSGVVAAAEVTEGEVRARLEESGGVVAAEPAADAPELRVLAAREEWLRLHPAWRLAGRWPRPGEAAVGIGLAALARPGAPATDAAPVVGELTTGEELDRVLFVPPEDLGRWRPAEPRPRIEVRATGGRVQAIARAIEAEVAGVDAQPLARISDSDRRLDRRLTLLLVAVAAVTLMLALLSVGTASAALVGERSRELALLLALGLEPHRIAGWLALELASAGLLAAALGELGGEAVARALCRHVLGSAGALGPTWGGAIGAVATTAVVLLASAGVAARRLVRLEPAGILKGE